MNIVQFDPAAPWTLAEVEQILRTQPPAVASPYITLMGGAMPRVAHLGSNEYVVAISDQQSTVTRYGVLDEAGYAALRTVVRPFQRDDYSYPQALARAIELYCYWQSDWQSEAEYNDVDVGWADA